MRHVLSRLSRPLLLALPPALALPLAGHAQTTFEVYGQLNFGIFSTDDGEESETYFTDNDNSNSRIGFNWAHDYGGGRTIRFNFETGLGLNGSSAVSMDDTDLEFDYSRTELRKFELIYKTPDIGGFSFGQGSMATDGTAEADFSGTNVIAYSAISDLAGSFEYRDGAGGFSGITIGDTFKSFDGSRRFRVRYDTPAWNGVVFSVAGGEEVLNTDDDNEYYDVAAKYVGDYGDLKVDTRLGYSWVGGGEDLLMGSVAALHVPTGLSLAVSSGAQQQGNDEYIYAKLGWQTRLIAQGITAFSIDLDEGSNYAIDRSDSTSVGLAVVQKIDALDLEIYGAWRTHEFDAPGERFQDVDVFALGARWRF